MINDIKKANHKSIITTLKTLDLPVSTKKSKEVALLEDIETLEEQFAKANPEIMGDCDQCGCSSPLDLESCPFCGTAGIADVENSSVLVETHGDEISDNAVVLPVTEAKPRKTKSRSNVTTSIDIDRSVLEKNVADILALKKSAITCYWDLGKLIYENYSNKLYTLMRNDDGTPKYKSWNQFTLNELGITPTHAISLMDVALNFDANTIEQLGTTKLALIAKLPPQERMKLLSEAKDLNVSEVAQEVRKRAGGVYEPTAAAKASVNRNPSEARAARKSDDGESKITVVRRTGKITLQFVQEEDPEKLAKALIQNPVCEEQAVNDVITRYRLGKSEVGGITLIIETFRESKLVRKNLPIEKSTEGKKESSPAQLVKPIDTKKSRGRPAKPKPVVDTNAAPKKRGRPPKAK